MAAVFLRAWRSLLVGLMTFASTAALAQAFGGMEVNASHKYKECLTPAAQDRGAPEYPENEYLQKVAGKAVVQLKFTAPDRAPIVWFVEEAHTRGFNQSIRKFVEQYRLPCMLPNADPVVWTQEFNFEPGDGKTLVVPTVKDRASKYDSKCLIQPKSRFSSNVYEDLIRSYVSYRILLSTTFTAQNTAPIVRVIYDGGRPRAAAEVKEHIETYRYTCPMLAGDEHRMQHLYKFAAKDAPIAVFKDGGLKEFLGMVDKDSVGSVKFDTEQMGCPFDLKVRVLQPYAPNGVQQMGTYDPRRRPLTQWIEKLKVNLRQDLEPKMIGESMRVTVGCMGIDL